MFRRFFLAATFTVPAVFFAQQPNHSGPSQPGMTQPGSPAVVVVPSSPSVFIVGGGPYSAYITPLTTLPMQDTGITLAGRAGISLETPLQTGVLTAVPSPFHFGAPIYFPGIVAGGAGTNATTNYVGPEPGERINDLGPSFYVGALPSAAVPSLGDVSRAYKRSHPRAARIFTNADAERLSNSPTTAPNQQNLPVKPPPQKENLREDPKTRMPRSTASAAAPGDVNLP